MDLGGHRGFLPVSHMALESILKTRLTGQAHSFKSSNMNPLLSSSLSAAQHSFGRRPGKQTQFGPSCSLANDGWVPTLTANLWRICRPRWGRWPVHVKSELDTNQEHPNEVLTEGQEIEVTVIDVDRERKRIALNPNRLK